jgi:LPS sulfotransferase NodH
VAGLRGAAPLTEPAPARRLFTTSMKHAFIISAPRSGTTWLVRALNAHPDMYATELRAFGEYADLVQDEGAAQPRLRITLDRYVDALQQAHSWEPLGSSRIDVRDRLVGALYETIAQDALQQTGKDVFVDKITPYLGTSDRVATAIARRYPDAAVIMLLRDGRDVAVSGVMHWLTKRMSGTSLSEHQRRRQAFFLERAGTAPDRFFTETEIEEWARHWREPIDAVTTHLREQALVVRYEDMSRDLATEIRRICERLGIDTSPRAIDPCVAESTFELMSGGRRRGEDAPGSHVRKGIVGDWQSYFTEADAAAFDRVAGRTLIEQGYEPDARWTMRLASRCHQ